MTVRFRLETITLDTTGGQVEHQFNSDLTVLAGPTGVGKTTLLELIKFGLGCNGTLAPVAVNEINYVSLRIHIGNQRLQLTRSLDKAKSGKVRVIDLTTQERLPDQNIKNNVEPSLNTLLMECLGLPNDMRATGKRSKTVGRRITFSDIFTYLYIPQSQINRDIAHSQDTYRDPKRKAVFEILFGLTDSEILGLQSKLTALAGEIEFAKGRHEAVVQFLQDSGISNREEAQTALNNAQLQAEAAETLLTEIRESLEPIADRETQTLRDLLTEAEKGLADSRRLQADLRRRRQHHIAERRRVQGELDRLRRLEEASHRLADIEFTVCPRCMQSIKERNIPETACRLCLQEDPLVSASDEDRYEVRQLIDQINEMGQQINTLDSQEGQLANAAMEQIRLIDHLNDVIEQRTAERITPRLQAFRDAVQRETKAKTEQEHWEQTLKQWDVVADLVNAVEDLEHQRDETNQTLDFARRSMQTRHEEIVDEISKEFDSTVRRIGIPSVVTAAVDKEKYLPVMNGSVFSKKNQLNGGVTTATQVAYWCSLIAVAMRRRDTLYPAFLVIDTPQLALNEATNLTAAMYRMLATQVSARPGELQIIVADHKLPEHYRGEFDEIQFNYDRPTISTIEHPGPARIELIHETDDEDE